MINGNAKVVMVKDDTGNIKVMSLNDAIKAEGLNPDTVRKRMSRNNMTLDEAISKELYYNHRRVKDPITGNDITLRELSNKCDKSVHTLYSRIIEAGWDVDRAMNEPVNGEKLKVKTITSNLGDTYSYNTWDKILGFGRGVISHKILRGRTEQEAITTGTRNGIYFIDPKTNKPIPQDQVGEDDFIN